MLTTNEAIKRRNNASKLAIEHLIKSVRREILEKRGDRLKHVVAGRVEAINTVRKILTRIKTNFTESDLSWARFQLEDLRASIWNLFIELEEMLKMEIDEEFDDNKLKTISEGKYEAFEQIEILLDGIKEIEKALETEDDIRLRSDDEVDTGQGYIENRAKSLRLEDKTRQRRR